MCPAKLGWTLSATCLIAAHRQDSLKCIVEHRVPKNISSSSPNSDGKSRLLGASSVEDDGTRGPVPVSLPHGPTKGLSRSSVQQVAGVTETTLGSYSMPIKQARQMCRPTAPLGKGLAAKPGISNLSRRATPSLASSSPSPSHSVSPSRCAPSRSSRATPAPTLLRKLPMRNLDRSSGVLWAGSGGKGLAKLAPLRAFFKPV